MIRTDKTNYNPNKDAGNWVNSMIKEDQSKNKNEEIKRDLEMAHKNLYERMNRGENVQDELMALRIDMASKGVHPNERFAKEIEQERLLQKKQKVFEDRVLKGMNRGQSEDEFYSELMKLQTETRNLVELIDRQMNDGQTNVMSEGLMEYDPSANQRMKIK